MALKSVYSFNDYRSFLREFYLEKKNANPSYSYKAFAVKAGLGSANYLKLVIDGKRNLTVTNIHQFGKALGLSSFEQEYFESLVLINQADSREEQAFYRKRLIRIKEGVPTRQLKYASERDLLSHFLFPAILMSSLGQTPQEVTSMVNRKLGLACDLIDNAVRAFTKSNILSVVDGRYQINSDHLVYHDPAPNRSQKQFLRSQLDFSRLAFNHLYESGSAKFCSHTFTIESSRFQECVDEVIRFMGAITQKYDGPAETSEVMQLNFQLFQIDRNIITKC